MFRFTIRELLLVTVIVAMGVVVWLNQRTTQIERASLEKAKREVDTRLQALDKEWRFLQNTAREKEVRANELITQRLRFLANRVPESERQRIIQKSAELGAPQPKPLPPGYGEKPNLDTTQNASPDEN